MTFFLTVRELVLTHRTLWTASAWDPETGAEFFATRDRAYLAKADARHMALMIDPEARLLWVEGAEEAIQK